MSGPRSKTILVAMAAGGIACGSASAQFTNPDFETGAFGDWTVTPTFNGTTNLQTVDQFDIDGPGPLGTNFAAHFQVGNAVSLSSHQAGIELSQVVNLTANTGYLIGCDYATINTAATGSNSEGGVFQIFVEPLLLPGRVATGSTSATTPHYGRVEGAFGPNVTGPYRVGVRITRPFTAPTNVQQYVDNFTIGAATVGACCLPDGSCVQTRSTDCTTLGGTYSGDGITCAAANCTQPGACCIPDAGCVIRSEAQCTALGGTYSGHGTSCAGAGCPTATVAYAPLANRETDGGTGLNTLVFNGAARIYQAAIAPSELSSIPAGSRITGMTYRLDNVTAATTWPESDATFAQYDVQLSAGGAGPGTLSPTFSANLGPSPVTVRSGPLVIPMNRFEGGAASPAVNPWGFVIPFDTPFVYDGGPLVVTVRHSGSDLSTTRVLDSVATSSPSYFTLVQAIQATSATATTGSTAAFTILRFTVQTGGGTCYANCDESTTAPILNVQDFTCFLQRYAAGDSYANCDQSTVAPVLNVQDFTCFLQSYAAGCP